MNLNNLNVHLYSRDSTMKLVQYSNGKCVDSQMDQIFYIMFKTAYPIISLKSK